MAPRAGGSQVPSHLVLCHSQDAASVLRSVMMALASLMEEGGRSKQPPPRVYHLDVGHLHGLELSGSIITLARQSRKGFYTQKLCVLQTQEFCF